MMGFDQAKRNGESQPGAAFISGTGVIGSVKSFKYLW
jgi:hypothetical protein